MERNRISSLQSHGKALEKECCLPGVFCHSGDTPANLLCELNGHLMPCTSCFYGKWVEDVCNGQFGVFVYLVFWAAAPGLVAVQPMWDSACVWYCYVPGHWLSSGPWQESGPIWAFVVIPHQVDWLFIIIIIISNNPFSGSLSRTTCVSWYQRNSHKIN